MYNVEDLDLVGLLKDSLLIMGCDESLIQNIDHHSTIEMIFDNCSPLFLKREDNGVFFWSVLSPFSEHRIYDAAPELLKKLMSLSCCAFNGQLQLVHIDDNIELRMMVSPEAYQSAELFAVALEEFYEQMQSFYYLLK